MKILFVENRYFTWILEAVAKELIALGHDIHWIVQNPMFTPSVGNVHIMPFPKAGGAMMKDSDLRTRLQESDRGVRWFGGDGSHWQTYHDHINRIIGDVVPDVVFSEVTQFHELLTSHICQQRGIPLLSPNVTRYPVGRLNFFEYNTMNPVGGEGIDLSDNEAEQMLNAIVGRTIQPSYMEKVHRSQLALFNNMLKDKLRILIGWCRGERYITPSPLTKIRLERLHARQYQRWESFAHKTLPTTLNQSPWVLLPLQMQPEANIEVWGSPWSDQTALVQRTAKALAAIGAVLVVKPNPKSKYELTAELCAVVEQAPNIVAISHTTSMKDIFAQAPLVMTVTGTVLMECIFAGKPVASLGTHVMTRYPGVQAIDAPEDVAQKLLAVIRNEIQGANKAEAKNLLNSLYKNSYPAMTWDPYTRPELMTENNIAELSLAFSDVINLSTCVNQNSIYRK
ncbi:MAG: hypothetical protein Q7R66_06735 [Undibacterium sp.]|uniref:hypothetical protein n=1 Tax=Undibacterium sp. TaxID=1914977 RepID=UPI002726C7CF|nr:hypothetical protein [Undibacterium sp.]MDO8651865.1 hypothetical protein [Undibacterium sp.]